MLRTLHYSKVKYLMAKNSLYKKLVRQFESTINNYQAVSSELDFTKVDKIISNQKKDNRYYRDIRQFLAYLRKFNGDNALIFFFPESGKKYQDFLKNVESLSARPLEASRQTRSTNNCVVADPYCYQYHDNLDMTVYQKDLQKSSGFLWILNRKQSIEFGFKDTTFILSKNCLSRQSLDKNPQSLCRSDYAWFLESMAIHFIGTKVRAVAQEQDLSQLNDTTIAKIILDMYAINPIQQDKRQLMRMDHLENFYEPELEKFIFNAEYLPSKFFPGGNSRNLLERVNYAVRLKITELKNLEPEESNIFTDLNKDQSRPIPANQSVISGVLQKTGINTTPSTSLRSAEGFNWKIIAPVIVVPAIIVPIIVFTIWYRKKFKSGNSEINMELNPFLNSISDSFDVKEHVKQLVNRLAKRLEYFKNLDRYKNEIGTHYLSLCDEDNYKKSIEDSEKLKETLTKFIEFEKAKLKNKDILGKLESALVIVESLKQLYNLLSLPNTIENKYEYLAVQLIPGLRKLINSMIFNIEFIRDNCKESDKIDKLVNCERAVYDANLIAHAEGYFAKYPPEQVINCLQLETTSIKDNHESELNTIKQIQGNLLSSLKIIIDSFAKLKDEFLISGKIELSNVADSIITQLGSNKSQLSFHFTDSNARRDEASKLKPTQAQEPIESSKLAFFKQPKSSQINQPAEIYNAGQILKP